MGRVRTLLAGAAAALLLLAGAACGERSEPTGSTVALYPITVQDAAQRPVTLFSRPRTIAALAPGSQSILAALGVRTGIERASLLDAKGRARPDRLRALHPALVVATPRVPPAIVQAAKSAGSALYRFPASSIDDVERGIEQLGLLTDHPLEARTLVGQIESERAAVARRLRGVPDVSVFVDTGFYTTLSTRTLAGDLIAKAHGTDVAGSTPEPGPFDLRELLKLDPDVYLATSDSGTTLATLRHNPLTRKLRAVRTGRFVTVDPSLFEPTPRLGESIRLMAKILHPDAFR